MRSVAGWRYGWINRAMPAGAINAFVDNLAKNIVALADDIIAEVKKAFPADEYSEGLQAENAVWAELLVLRAATRLMLGGLELGAQTPDFERNIRRVLRELVSR